MHNAIAWEIGLTGVTKAHTLEPNELKWASPDNSLGKEQLCLSKSRIPRTSIHCAKLVVTTWIKPAFWINSSSLRRMHPCLPDQGASARHCSCPCWPRFSMSQKATEPFLLVSRLPKTKICVRVSRYLPDTENCRQVELCQGIGTHTNFDQRCVHSARRCAGEQ